MDDDQRSVSSNDSYENVLETLNQAAEDDFPDSVVQLDQTVKMLDQTYTLPAAGGKAKMDVAASEPAAEASLLKPRSYQKEMLEKSLEGNIIAAMDTGSGKTLVAILRMEAELERSSKRIWFLATTVALAKQQSDVIKAQLPAVNVRLLSSMDNVEHWSEQRIWDAVLRDIQIVVSTHNVLYDALVHGFVRIQDFSLLVFDEAHHCTQSHPANLILRSFYHPRRRSGEEVPAILGMTASPIVNSKPEALETIESNMNAISKTPAVHSMEFHSFVHRPQLERHVFRLNRTLYQELLILIKTCEDINIVKDPYVIKLAKDDSAAARESLRKVMLTRKTYTTDTLRKLLQKTKTTNEEVGPWASKYYLAQTLDQLITSLSRPDTETYSKLETAEKLYLVSIINDFKREFTFDKDLPFDSSELSPKIRLLIDILLKEHSAGVSCIVFVKQRVVVSLLYEVLKLYAPIESRYRMKTFVGQSVSSKRALESAMDLVDLKSQVHTLEDFRSGRVNLIFATSVLEEGIDISACNTVISFDKPANLKSYIQVRGRARKMKSKFIIMFDQDDSLVKENSWHQLEQQMIQQYQDDMRKLEEDGEEEECEDQDVDKFLLVPQTGARLSLNDSIKHLHHFCDKLPRSAFSDTRPEFSVELSGHSMFKASITLPNSLDPSLRSFESSQEWPNRRLAKQDAAFEAYSALYYAGLVNDNLLPLSEEDDELQELVEKRPAMVECQALTDPWSQIAQAWTRGDPQYAYSFSANLIGGRSSESASLQAHLPVKIEHLESFSVYWDVSETFKIDFSQCGPSDSVIDDFREGAVELLKMTQGLGRISRPETDLLVPISYPSPLRELFAHASIKSLPLISFGAREEFGCAMGTLHDVANGYAVYRALKWAESDDTIDTEAMEIDGQPGLRIDTTRVPKRADFLHRIARDSKPLAKKQFKSNECVVGQLPFYAFQAAKFIPSITHKIAISLLTQSLCETVLSTVTIQNSHLILTAITSPMACEGYDYQSLEFYGDSLLKFLTATNLYGDHPTWHEGYLSSKKDRMVSNKNLSKACLEVGIDAFIITRPFTGLKWRPKYVSDFSELAVEPVRRELSTKVLADVMEALLGACYVDGGLPTALSCIQVLLPAITWTSPIDALSKLQTPQLIDLPVHFRPLADFLPYTFKHNSYLLEAFTHNSYPSRFALSYQRLEFLGDAVLDHMIVSHIFARSQTIPPGTLHLLKAAVVSHNFLAFLCMETATTSIINKVIAPSDTRTLSSDLAAVVEEETVTHPLWHFMRYCSPAIQSAQNAAKTRHSALAPAIREALTSGAVYPWTLLAKVSCEKFFSDVVESLLGAVYVDSSGDLGACEALLSKLGVWEVLDRLLLGDVELMPPKNRLGIWASERLMSVRYESGAVASLEDDDDKKTQKERETEEEKVYCRIYIEDEEVVRLVGQGKPAIENEGAEMALELMIEKEKAHGAKLGGSKGKRKRDANESQEQEMTKKVEVEATKIRRSCVRS